MRKFFLFFAAVFFLLSFSCIGSAAAGEGRGLNSDYVLAYYFFGNFRCSSCYRIEQYSRDAIEQYFREELNSGEVVFKPINIEEKQNEHFVDDYRLYTKSLVISLVKGGKEVKFKNLTKVWDYLNNREKFYNYVRDEIAVYLKELR